MSIMTFIHVHMTNIAIRLKIIKWITAFLIHYELVDRLEACLPALRKARVLPPLTRDKRGC